MNDKAEQFIISKLEKMNNDELVECARGHRQNARSYESGLNGQLDGANLEQLVTNEMRAGGLVYRYAHFNRPEIASRVADALR